MKKAKPRPVGKGGDNDLRDLIAWAKQFGFVCEQTRGNHLVFRRPSTMPVYVALTASCHRARQNNRRDLKHAIRESEQRKQLREAG